MSQKPGPADELYQRPLSEFTKARDALAKRAGSDGAAIRRLQKPNVAAWAVNQLYWHARGVYEALVAAAGRLRKAQVTTLAGKSADVARAEADHGVARKAAADRIRRILVDAGEKATPATLRAINETLEALPTAEPPGRLVRPLKPMGFEGLAGLLKGGKIVSSRADVLPFRKASSLHEEPAKTPKGTQAAAAAKLAEKQARRDADARNRMVARLTARLRQAEAGERTANMSLARAKDALAKAERDHHQAAARLEAAAVRLEELNREVRASERRASQAGIARADLQGQLNDLGPDRR